METETMKLLVDEHTVEVKLSFYPKRGQNGAWGAMIDRIDHDKIEVFGRTAEAALFCLEEQLRA